MDAQIAGSFERHPECSGESVRLIRCERRSGFFAALRMTDVGHNELHEGSTRASEHI